jgi:hypothetical protein
VLLLLERGAKWARHVADTGHGASGYEARLHLLR